MFDGVKLNDAFEVGAESEPLTAQHKRVAFAAGVWSLLFARLQHFIILSFDEWSGVPDTTPLARATSMKSNVSLVTI